MERLREKDDICYRLASMQARIFEKSANEGIASYFFIQQFAYSFDAEILDNLRFLLSGFSELEIYLDTKRNTKRQNGKVFPPEVMHWIGYFYRNASYLMGINSKTLFKKIPPQKLYNVYPLYHGLDIQKAIDMVFETVDFEELTPLERFKKLYEEGLIDL